VTLALLPLAAAAEPWASVPRPKAEAPELVLDLSRLLSRVLHASPTGIDRVEMAYASGLLRLVPDRLSFAAVHPSGLHGRLPRNAAIDFLGLTADRWEREGPGGSRIGAWGRAVADCWALAPSLAPPPRSPPQRVYLHLSPRGLERQRLFRRALRREQARLVAFVHDIIPLEHPEFVRPGGSALFLRKLATVFALAAGILVNSEATKTALTTLVDTGRRAPPIRVARLGVSQPWSTPAAAPAVAAGPYFVALGTIEPRKNHLLLLHLWRRLLTTLGRENTPQLVLVGRRGWENEMVLDLLDRTPGFAGVVHERGRMSDADLRPLIQGARAVLMPSFSEGYGLPVAEALALGVPVIASDLPALREAGGGVPDHLDPLDGPAWTAAILDYAQPQSPMRAEQMIRLGGWRPPTWDEHLRTALSFISEVAR
jgi:glycosyltransferase involved in cell wall biosynthesis